MPVLDKVQGLLGDFLLIELAAHDGEIVLPEAAVQAVVGANVSQIKWGKEYHAFSVDLILDPAGQFEDLSALAESTTRRSVLTS